ncbi:MAG: AAA family ATPase [Rickettsiales bacterium]|nr:AAA family ATPase [Rickettsiales bacterium]
MKLHLENIGKIKKADIEIGGLTVLAGENDTGKSTVGKVLFSIIKGIANPNIYNENNIFLLKRRLRNLMLFSPDKLEADLENDFDEIREILSEGIFTDLTKSKICNFIKKISSTFNEKNIRASKIFIERRAGEIKRVEDLIDDIFTSDKKHKLEKTFKKIFKAEFKNDLINKYSKYANIRLVENEKIILDINLNKVDNDFEVKINKIIERFIFNDITLTETPAYINLSELIGSSNTILNPMFNRGVIFEDGNVIQLHLKDLIIKLRRFSKFQLDDLEKWVKPIIKNMQEIVGGSWDFDIEQREFYFKPITNSKTVSFSGWNVACGVKSLGIIEMLLRGGDIISSDKPLIIDEPEVHVHPEWQIKYAEVLAELVKNGIPVIVSSHSNVFIQALLNEVERKKLDNKSNFYFGKKNNDGTSDFKLQKDNFDDIFDSFLKPLLETINKK